MQNAVAQIERLLALLQEPFGEKRNRVYAELLELATAQPERFAALVRQFPLDQHSSLFELYEVLGADADQFADFLVEEAHRLLSALEDPANKSYPHRALQGFYTIESDAVRERIQHVMLRHARSDSVHTKRSIAFLLPEYADEWMPEVQAVFERFSKDKDWRVRVLAQQALNLNQGDPLNANLHWLDRLRLRFQNLYHWK